MDCSSCYNKQGKKVYVNTGPVKAVLFLACQTRCHVVTLDHVLLLS